MSRPVNIGPIAKGRTSDGPRRWFHDLPADSLYRAHCRIGSPIGLRTSIWCQMLRTACKAIWCALESGDRQLDAWMQKGSVLAAIMILLANLPVPFKVAGRKARVAPRLNQRLRAFLIAALSIAAMAPAQAQSNSGYDPRSWTYDPARNVLVSPSAPDQTSDGETRSDWSATPREIVHFSEAQPKGSIVISTTERRLYYILGNGRALRYAVGVGKEGLEWAGRDTISSKKTWPDWRPPAEMRSREASNGRFLPAHVEGGPNNPLGARALYIGNTLYRVHGTNQPWTVGQANSSGCIRMTNDDVIDLYDRVKIGSQIIVRH
ncbi:L,D-transpeptidase [Mesorhizobium sp.]|uniref:L,D-transpeptidase n=1 Tax=Mesorhizobium sp. TaxID=1871066 RepID=UPI00338D67DC